MKYDLSALTKYFNLQIVNCNNEKSLTDLEGLNPTAMWKNILFLFHYNRLIGI